MQTTIDRVLDKYYSKLTRIRDDHFEYLRLAEDVKTGSDLEYFDEKHNKWTRGYEEDYIKVLNSRHKSAELLRVVKRAWVNLDTLETTRDKNVATNFDRMQEITDVVFEPERIWSIAHPDYHKYNLIDNIIYYHDIMSRFASYLLSGECILQFYNDHPNSNRWYDIPIGQYESFFGLTPHENFCDWQNVRTIKYTRITKSKQS